MQPFIIYVIWHPRFEEGQAYAASVFRTFNRDFSEPFNRSVSIPVYYRSIGVSGSETEMPAAIDPSSASRIAVIVLVDDFMIIHRDEWEQYLNRLKEMDDENEHMRVFPVAISRSASSVNSKLNRNNYIRLFSKETLDERLRYLNISFAHECCRMLLGFNRASDEKETPAPRLKLFLSHSKSDGVELTKLLRYWMQEFTGLQSFFDTNDIPPGESFGEVIRDNIDQSSLLVIQTDIYGTREWCRAEVLQAKKYHRPVVVVNALEKGESRSFPYMNNVPVVRWAGQNAADFTLQIERIILTVLLETLRFRFQEELIKYQFDMLADKPKHLMILKHAPELLDLLGDAEQLSQTPAHYLYPDPPLGNEELKLLKRFAPDAAFTTPVQLIRELAATGGALANHTIGISISESGMMEERGLSVDHLKDVMVEGARYLLAAGYSIAYGGDINYSDGFNFVNLLKDMVLTYRADYKQKNARVTNYVAYPLSRLIKPSLEASLIEAIKFVHVPPAAHLPFDSAADGSALLKGETVEDQFRFSECLTAMRMQMNAAIDARIVLGGKLTGYKGKYPGLLEEVLIAVKSAKPVYLIGAFGGCTAAIIEAIKGSKPETLTQSFQEKNVKYKNLVNYYQSQNDPNIQFTDYDTVVRYLNEQGIKGLNNGLTEAENEVLFSGVDTTHIVSLMLKGLKISCRP